MDMGEQPTFVMVPAGEMEAMRKDIQRLAQMIEGATITPPNEWLPIPDAAEALGVDVSTVHRRLKAGSLEARGSGRLRRVKVPQSSRRAISSASSSK